MSDAKQSQLEKFKIETATKILCLNAMCANLVPEDCCCNLKRLVINAGGKCAGLVKMAAEKKAKTPHRKDEKSAKEKK